MEELQKLLEMLEGKLTYAKRLIAEYDDTMDYASHCNLLGFAEGIEFVMEEIEEMLEGKGKGQGSGVKNRGTSEERGRDKSKGKSKDKHEGGGKGKSRGKGKAEGKGRGRGKG